MRPGRGPGVLLLTRAASRASLSGQTVVQSGHAYLEGTLTAAPDSQAAYATIDRARTSLHAVPGGDALVGGNTRSTWMFSEPRRTTGT